MYVTVKEPPYDLPVTVAEAKAHCIIDHDAHDAMLEQFIRSSVEQLVPLHGWLGRPIMQTTFEAHLSRFKPIIQLPFPPLVSVTSIKYVDKDGASQTVDTDVYEVITTREPGRVELVDGKAWPSDARKIVVEFVAGYAEDVEDVPGPIRHYILLSVAEAYSRRELSEMGIVLTGNKFWLSMLEGWRFRYTEDD